MVAERSEDRGEATRARRRRELDGERVTRATRTVDDDDDEEMRPRHRMIRAHEPGRHARRSIRLASLGRELAPSHPALPSIVSDAPELGPQQAHFDPAAVRPMLGSLSGPLAPPVRPGAPRRKQLGPMVASLGREFALPAPTDQPPLTGGHINWVASASCLASRLRAVLVEVAATFGPVRVNSTCRSPRHNARVGGAPRSYHLTGSAADFRVSGHFRQVLAFLRAKRTVGGLKHYGGGVFHIDTGPRRTW
jgi:hypothetical protein